MLPGRPSSRFHARRKGTVQRGEQRPAAAHGLQQQLQSQSRTRSCRQRERLRGGALLPKPPQQKTSPKVSTRRGGAGRSFFPWEAGGDQISGAVAVGQAGREGRNNNCQPKGCEESPRPGAGLCVCWSPRHTLTGLGGRGGWLGGRRGAPGDLAAVQAAQPPSQLLDLLSDNDGVFLTDLLGGFCLVVVGAGVHVGVPVDGAEQVPAAAVEA